MLLLYFPEYEKSNIRKSNKIFLTNSAGIFNKSKSKVIKTFNSESEIIEISNSLSEIIIISDTNNLFIDMKEDISVISGDNSYNNKRLFIYYNYVHKNLASSIKIFYADLALIRKITILYNIIILYHSDI